jgi:hypothetical protein
MSKNLKQRIESLAGRTGSKVILSICETALAKFDEYANLNMPSSVMENLETVIAEDLIASLNDEGAILELMEDGTLGAILEFTDIAINNIGVRKGYADLKKNLSSNIPLRYVLEKNESLLVQPEWAIYEKFVDSLKPFDFDPDVKDVIQKIHTNASKYSQDIKIYRAVHEAKVTKANYLVSTVQPEIDSYLATRTASTRSILLEKLNKYIFDPTIKKLYNTIVETANSFEIKASSNDAIIKRVYSPVLVTNENETFVVHGKVFEKIGDQVRPLEESKIAYLPKDFLELANFINQQNVEISENMIKVFSREKKITVNEEYDGSLKISINEKKVSPAEFNSIYLASGVFNQSEIAILRAVNSIVENWSSIMEIDFAKSIYSKAYPNRRADIFLCGEKLHINTVDFLMNENLFHPNCTAHQSRNHILEFVNYDLTLTFESLMTPEKKEIAALESKKAEYLEAIDYLNSKKKLLESQGDAVRNTPEIKGLLTALEEEIVFLKKNYSNAQSRMGSLVQVTEGVGTRVGDTAEYLKKK